MLSVSTPALQQLHSSLMASTDPDKCFRIIPKDAANLTLKYMELQEDDRTFEFDGRTVLALPKELEPICANKLLDINDRGALELA
jgi:hypothetical protein